MLFKKSFLGAVVEDVRTVFEPINDATIYIPDLQPIGGDYQKGLPSDRVFQQ